VGPALNRTSGQGPLDRLAAARFAKEFLRETRYACRSSTPTRTVFDAIEEGTALLIMEYIEAGVRRGAERGPSQSKN